MGKVAKVVAMVAIGASAIFTGGLSLAAGGFLFGAATAKMLIGLGISLVLSGISGALQKKPSGRSLSDPQARQITIRQSAAPRRVIYGTIRVGGVLTFIHEAGSYLYLVITLAGHQVDSISDPFFDGAAVTLDGSGNCVTGDFAGLVHVEKNLGSDSQAAFAGLVAAVPAKWTANHRQRGCASVYVRLSRDGEKFPHGLPNITFDVGGRLVYDPGATTYTITGATNASPIEITTSAPHGGASGEKWIVFGVGGNTAANDEWNITVTGASTFTLDGSVGNAAYTSGGSTAPMTYSNLSALCLADYLMHKRWGMGCDYTAKIGNAALIAAANICVENVTLRAGGTENRYTCNGAFDTSEMPGDVIPQIAGSMAGVATYIAGRWEIYAGAYRSPTVTLTDADIIAPIKLRRRLSRRELFNGVKGVFMAAGNNWQMTDFPPVLGAAYLAADNNERTWHDVAWNFTVTPSMAQRLSKIMLERVRREATVQLSCKLGAYQIQPPDVVQVTYARFSWSAKTFECVESKLVTLDGEDGSPALAVELTLRETDSNVYAWTPGTDETLVTAAGEVTLPDANPDASTGDAAAPSGLTAFTVESPDRDGYIHLSNLVFGSPSTPLNVGGLMGATLALQYISEVSQTYCRLRAGVTDVATSFPVDEDFATTRFAVNDYVPVAQEIVKITAIANDGGESLWTVERAQFGTTGLAYLTSQRLDRAISGTFFVPMRGGMTAEDFDWFRQTFWLPGVRVVASALYLTNQVGDSATITQNHLSYEADTGALLSMYGVRTNIDDQYIWLIDGWMPGVDETEDQRGSMAARYTSAIKFFHIASLDGAIGGTLYVKFFVNAVEVAEAAIANGQTESTAISGALYDGLTQNDILTIRIIGASATGPGGRLQIGVVI